MSNFCQQGDITKIFIVDTGNTGSTGTDIYVTGGTYFGGTLTLGRNDGVSISIPGFLTGSTSADIYVTGGTYFGGTLTLGRNDGVTIPITGFSTTSIFTGNTSASCITDLYITNLHGCSPITIWDPIVSLSSISATTYYGDGSNLSGIPDYYVTGGTYSNGGLTLNRQNGIVTVTGFSTTDTFVTGFTYNDANRLTISQNGGQSPLTVTINNFTGLTVTGSISATTYLNLPAFITGFTDNFVTGGTFSSGTLTLNRQNGIVTVTGFTSTDTFVTGFTFTNDNTLTIGRNQGLPPLPVIINNLTLTGLTVNGVISASTYLNLPAFITGFTDTYVTGFTYNDANRLTISQNQGQPPLNVFINTFTGLTVNGSVSATTLSAVALSPVSYIDFNINPTIPSITGGTLYFDYNENALSYKPITSSNDVTINIGQESLIRVYNNTGAQINNGQVLHITGATGGIPTVALANASKLGLTFTDSLAQSSGVATHNIPNGEFGFITNFGVVRDLNTSGFTVGQELFLSDTIDGGITDNPNSIAFTSRISTIGWCLSSDPVNGKIYVKIENENPLQSLTQQEINVLLGNTISTGAYFYTGTTTASTTTINVSQMRGWIAYNTYGYSTSPLVLNIYYSGGTNISLPNLTSSDATYLLVNSGSTLYQQTSFPTPQQRRENIFLGKVVHPNRTTILNVNNTVDYDVSPMSSLRDLWSPIKLINDGVLVSPNGSNLNINISSGTLWGNGIGWVTNELNPNSVVISAKIPASFFYRTQTGGTSSSVSVIDPTKYDVNGVITSMGGAGSDNASNQRVYLYPTGVLNILYGQTNYNNLTDAVAGIQTESFVVYPNAKNTGVLIGIISVRNDIVADGQPLTNSSYAIFTPASKFGELLGGTGGLSTTTLQQAYNNSVNPEIVTNSTLDGVQFRGGTGSDTDKNIIIENNAGTPTSWLNADGSSLFTTLTATTKIITTNFQMTSGATNGYVLTSDAFGNARWAVSTGGSGSTTGTDYYVTGGTYNNTTGTLTLNRQNGSVIITGFTTSSSSGGTGIDTYVTGFTYSNNNLSINQNQGQSPLSVTINNFTGLTVNGSLSASTYLGLPSFTFTGNTSASCISDIYVSNLHGCSPITIHDSIKSVGSSATGITSFAFGNTTVAAGDYSHAEGDNTQAIGTSSHAEGSSTITTGTYSHAEGDSAQAIGGYSHAEGYLTKTIGDYSHTEGNGTLTGQYFYTTIGVSSGVIILDGTYGDVSTEFTTTGIILEDSGTFTWYQIDQGTPPYFDGTKTIITLTGTSVNSGTNVGIPGVFQPTVADILLGSLYSHAEGEGTIAIGYVSHAEGKNTTTIGAGSHAEGGNKAGPGPQAIGDFSHAEGDGTTAQGEASHAEGLSTTAIGGASHAEGKNTTATGDWSHVEGNATEAIGGYSHAEGTLTIAEGTGSHAEGESTTSSGVSSHAEGESTTSSGVSSHAEGGNTEASGLYSHTEGVSTNASGTGSHAEGSGGKNYGSIGDYSHTEGRQTTTNGNYSHAEGYLTSTNVKGVYSHAEGYGSQAGDIGSHAEGYFTQANGNYSHSQGTSTVADGDYSFASGSGSTAQGALSFVHSINSVAAGEGTVVLGGVGISGTTPNMVYVSTLNINSTPVSNSGGTQVLVRNSSTGNIEYRDSSTLGGGTGTDTYVTGFTYSNNNLSINQNQGQLPLTVTINNFTGLTINGSLSASTYLGFPSNIYETTTDGAVTSASTSNVYTSGVLVPANSFTVGNNAELTVRGRKTGTAGNMTMRVYINTINSISGSPILVATNTTAATNQTYLQFQRFLSIKSTGTTEVFSNTGGSNIDWLSSNLGINQLSVNWANDLYIVVATQCTVGTDSINARSSFIKIKR